MEARVLVVDDEEQIRRLVRILLMRLQDRYSLVINEAASVEQAMPLLERQAFHLIISDHNMPGKTGVDLLNASFRRAPQTGRMLITALTQMDVGVEAVNRGHVDAFLRKPWDNAAFVALVDSLLETRTGAPPPVAPARAAAPAPAPATKPMTTPRPPPATATRPVATVTAGSAGTTQTPREVLELELRDVERKLAQLRVRLGLGNISAEGYSQLNRELADKRAKLELQLMRNRA